MSPSERICLHISLYPLVITVFAPFNTSAIVLAKLMSVAVTVFYFERLCGTIAENHADTQSWCAKIAPLTHDELQICPTQMCRSKGADANSIILEMFKRGNREPRDHLVTLFDCILATKSGSPVICHNANRLHNFEQIVAHPVKTSMGTRSK